MNGTTVFIDFETGGTESRHPNIQLAAIAVRGGSELEAFERKIRFDPRACDPKALELNHYSAEAWQDAGDEGDIAFEFAAFLKRHADMPLVSKRGTNYTAARLAGHNIVAFDGPRLRTMMDKALNGAFWPGCWWYPLDTYQRSIWWFTERGLPMPASFRIEALAQHFGIDASGAHDALADVRICAALAERLGAAS